VQTRFKLAFLVAIVGVAAFGGTVLATSTQDELAQVRRATAQFHRLEAAIDAGYTLALPSGHPGTDSGTQRRRRRQRSAFGIAVGNPIGQSGSALVEEDEA
jgi:hypothetical protein